MNKNTRKKRIKTSVFVLLAFFLVCWDFKTSLQYTVYSNSFRYESEFDAITAPTTPVKVAVVPSDYTDLADPVSRDTDPTYEQIEAMVRKAIELQGGFDGVIAEGNTVMLKVNLVGGNSPSGEGENTDVRVVKAVIKTIYDFQNNVEIIVAEGTARSNDDPAVSGSVWHNSGYIPLLTDPYLSGINLRFVNLNQSLGDLIEIDLADKGTAATHDYKYHVHKEELNADVYISVPVLKIHSPGMTCALKNQIGTAPGCYYGYNKQSGKEKDGSATPSILHAVIPRQDWSEEEIVDLSNIAGIDFVVVDAIMCLEIAKSYKPERQLRMNTIIAGYDPVAVDNVCTRLFGLNPDDIVHIFLAEKMGLGTNNPDYIEVVGASIASTMKRAKKGTIYGSSNRTWLLSPAFDGTDIAVEHITDEKDYIAEAGKDGWSEPVFFFDDEIDLGSFYDGKENMVSYAFTKFYSPVDTAVELWLGRQEAMYVYINGEKVYSETTNEDFSGRKEADINVKKGENTLLVKTLNQFGAYTFALNICEVESDNYYKGNRLPGLKFYTDTIGTSEPVGVFQQLSANEITLTNYPNPCNDFTTIKFTLPKSDIANINIYDLTGKLIKNVAINYYPAGTQEIRCETADLKSGYYLCRMKAGKYSKSIMLLVK
ncbi:MAG: DUF362 domain-containing protein [Bacteroidales bacterium]|nr:DUF362 domain-containing protein [Bacteroidales bacterium]